MKSHQLLGRLDHLHDLHVPADPEALWQRHVMAVIVIALLLLGESHGLFQSTPAHTAPPPPWPEGS